MRTLLLAGTAAAALSLIGSFAWAENGNQNDHQNLRSNLMQMLQKSGYTDIRLAPSSFMVHAKDQNGNPVMMSISPDEFAEVTSVGTTTGAADHDGTKMSSDDASTNTSTFVSVPQQDDLSSKVVGLDIYNNDKKDIGTIKDIALNPTGRTTAYIVSVGGFLGMGDHYVAISPSAVNVSYNDSDKKWHANMNASADQLKSAPEFKYVGHWNSSHT